MSEVGKIKIAIDNPMDQILGNYGNASSKSNTNSSNTKMNAMKMESFDVSSFNFNNSPSIHEDFVKIMSIDKSSLPSEEELEKYYDLLNRGKSSLSQEEYLLYVICYQYERNQELKSYQDLLKIVNEELNQKEEIRKSCEDWKSSIEELQLSTENYTLSLVNRYKEIASYENQKENELLNEELKKYELTITDIKNKSTEELIEILKNKNEEVKARYEEIENQNKFLNGYTKQETEFDNYEDFHNYVLEMDESKILLESAIKTTNKMIASAEYSHLNLLEDYQAYENKEEIVTSLEGYQNKDGVFYKNLSQIDALSRASEMNPELGKVYNYLYETQGKEKANDYLKQMEETLNQINGQVNAEKFLSTLKDEKELMDYLENHLKVGGKGIYDGIGSFFEGIGDWVTGKDFYSESEYETMYILQALQGDSEKHYDWALQHNYNMTQSMGNMLPSIALSMLLTPAVGGSVASTVGSVSMGVSAGGKSYHNALVEGRDTARSVFYGVLSGVSEAALQKLVGGIVGLSDVEVVDLKSLATSMLHEGLEEGSQEYLDALFKYGLWNEKQDFSELSQNAFVSAIYGSLTAGVMNGIGLGVNKIANGSTQVFDENYNQKLESENFDAVNESIEVLEDIDITEKVEVFEEGITENSSEITERLKKIEEEITEKVEVLEEDITEDSNEITERLKEIEEEITEKVEVLEEDTTEDSEEVTEKLEAIDDVLDSKTWGEINQIQTINGLNLKNEILSTLSSKMSDISKMRKLYLELNKRLSYDINYLISNESKQNNIANQNKVIDFNHLKNKDVICFGWSRLYKELLIEAGIAEDRITIMGKNHHWIEIDVDDGIIIADATENIKGIHDLANAKVGAPTVGFAYLNKTESGTRLHNYTEDTINSIIKKQWINVDKEIGYLKHNKYTDELYLEAKLKFQDSATYQKLFSANEFNDKLKVLLRSPINENMSGLEAFLYYKKMAKNVFNVNINKNMLEYNGNTIKFEWIPNFTAQGVDVISKITVTQSNGEILINLYSGQFGIKTFNNEINANEYIRHPN